MLLSLVAPCYNESAVLLPFIAEVERVAAILPTDVQIELLLVDSGGTDDSLHVMQELAARYVCYYGCGGIPSHKTSARRVLSSSVFHRLEAITRRWWMPIYNILLRSSRRCFTLYEREGYDCAGARRTRKGDPPLRSFWVRMFYWFINLISGTKLADGTTDYKLFSRRAVDAFLAMPEYNRFSKRLYQWIGFRTEWMEYENVQCVAGETRWSFWKLLKYALEGILSS